MLSLIWTLAAPPPPTLWAGVQEVTGERAVPVIGTLKTTNRSWFLAERRETADGFELVQRACGVHFAPVMGVQVAIPDAAIQRVPPATVRLKTQPDGTVGAVGAESGWDRGDVDGDGRPGLTVTVKAAICGGALQVASAASTAIRLRVVGEALEGQVKVRVKQTVLGADGACLKKAAEDTDETHAGWVRLVPVPAGATCKTWQPAQWPALKRDAPR